MCSKRYDIDTDHMVNLYKSWVSQDAIAAEFGVSRKVIRKRLVELGIENRGRKRAIDEAEMVRLYESGATKHDIAVRFGVSEMTIGRRLAEHGYPCENRSDAMRTRLARMTPEQRSALTASAHDAVRGMKRTDADLCKRAASKEAAGKPGSIMEDRLGRMLRARGLDTVHQKAVGKYNIDIAVNGSVAVEISGRPKKGVNAERIPHRLEYLGDCGWSFVIVWSSTTHRPVNDACAEKVASLCEQACGDPSARGKYWVVWGDGEFMAEGSVYDDTLPGVLTPISSKRNRA